MRIHFPQPLLGCLPLLIPSLLLADANLSSPIAGYVADPSQPVLRTISGVPGAYLFSDPIPLPDGVTRIHLAPGPDYALIESGDAAPAVLFLSAGAVDHVAPLPGAMPAADWVAFSASGRAAVLFSSSAQRLQLLTGLPAAPQLALDLDASTFPEQPLSAALSDDGSLLLIASRNSVYRLSPGGPPQLLLSVGRIVSLAVLRNGAGVAVSDASTASIHLLRNLDSTLDIRVLVSGLSGIGRLYPATDGATLFVARPAAKAVLAVDLASGDIQTFPTSTAPVQLVPLRNRDTFLISAKPGQPGSVFWRDGNAGRFVFIPAIIQEVVQ
ncbi:exported hypothetical protein [Candidatus Sulfopaludibacter sp. SbA4]|nr:exported hypothetical protein [Candidatus Sulfopaludibacter sp. SbA4]